MPNNKQDRNLVSGRDADELDRFKAVCKPGVVRSQILHVFESIDDGAVTREQMMFALDAAGLLKEDEPGSSGHENEVNV